MPRLPERIWYCTIKTLWNNDEIINKLFYKNGILLPKLFWPIVRKKCSSDWEKLLKFEAEGQEFTKFLRSLEQFIQTVKGQSIFCNRIPFFSFVLGGF